MNASAQRLTSACYFVAFLFFLGPIVDVVTNVWPWVPGSEQWRFGLGGVMSGYLISVIFGLAMASYIAALNGHRKTLKAISVVAAVGALFLLIMSGSFILDTLQVRNVVRPEQLELFKIGAAKTLGKLGASMIALIFLTWGAFKASREAPETRKDSRVLIPQG